MDTWTKILSPGSVGNVGPGFDILSYALEEPYDIIWVRKSKSDGVKLVDILGDVQGILPKAIDKNTATLAASLTLETAEKPFGVEMIIEKKMPVGSGMGSSAASAVGGAVAVNFLLGNTISQQAISEIVGKTERAITGNYGDNGIASLLGGFVLVTHLDPLQGIRLGMLDALWSVVVYPHMYLATKDARAVLPENVPLRNAVQNNVNTAKLLVGIMNNDSTIFAQGLQDVLIEPYREKLIPGFRNVQNVAMKEGALGCSIAGAGPSVFAFAQDKERAETIANAMVTTFSQHGLSATSYVGKVNSRGAHVIEE